MRIRIPIRLITSFCLPHICRCRRFCQTAFSSMEGARRTIVYLLELRLGVLVNSGVQCVVGLSTDLPFGSIVNRNSVAVISWQREGEFITKIQKAIS